MKLLLDQNISFRVVDRIIDLFPETIHVRSADLQTASDEIVWNFARDNQFVIVSKDGDFHQRSFLFGSPPKVIWLRLGNCSTEQIVFILRDRIAVIRAFYEEEQTTFLVIDT